jgi:hypothetical protein
VEAYFMKIPIFEEIIFESFDEEEILEKINDTKIGKVPTFINLNQQNKSDRIDSAILLQKIFVSKNLNPRFPYPCYLIGEIDHDRFFPTAKNIKELPDHFFKKVKRPNNRELQLLNKLALKVEKINYLELNHLIEEFKDTGVSQKRLYFETKELYFYEFLHHKLVEREKAKNGKKI